MKQYKIEIIGAGPLQQGRFHNTEKLEKEQNSDYERRTWKNKAHTDKEGNVLIPPMAFKNCLVAAAKYTGRKIIGEGKKTYTAKFTSGTLINEPMLTGNHIDDAQGLWVFGDSKGQRGSKSGTRVEKCFPTFSEWGGALTIWVLDETITLAVLHEHLIEAGRFIGIGVFRPENNGYYGRFEVKSIDLVK